MKTKLIIALGIALSFSLLSVNGCASHKKQSSLENFDQTIRLYGRLLRWKEYEGAVNMIRHQDESTVEVDLAAYKDLRVTDYDVKKVVMGEELRTAEVIADIAYYFETTNSVETIRDTQSWWYNDEAKTWYLDDDLPDFQ